MEKYAVVTGASSGIGAEVARELARRGYSIVLVARRVERLEELAATLPGKSVILAADLSEVGECERVMREVADLPMEVFINNAGFGDCGAFVETSLAKELSMIDVNVRAVHVFTKLAVQRFKEQGGGYVLNVASSAGLFPGGPYMATYYATKAYVTSLTQAVACELSEDPTAGLVRVSCLCPGPVDTEFNQVASVEFSLPGITPEYCAHYAVDQLFRGKTVIVPTARMKAAVIAGRLVPRAVAVKIAGYQQKKKLYR